MGDLVMDCCTVGVYVGTRDVSKTILEEEYVPGSSVQDILWLSCDPI